MALNKQETQRKIPVNCLRTDGTTLVQNGRSLAMISWNRGPLHSVTPYKICPRCGAKAALTAPHCLVCDRPYHTVFVSAPAAENGIVPTESALADEATPTLSRTQLGLDNGSRAEIWMIVLITAVAILILAALGSVRENEVIKRTSPAPPIPAVSRPR